MTIRVRIEHDDQSIDREFDDTVAMVTFLNIAGYYIEKRGMEAMFKRFCRRDKMCTTVHNSGEREFEHA